MPSLDTTDTKSYPFSGFFKDKSVQKTYNFGFWMDDTGSEDTGDVSDKLSWFLDNNIERWHIVDVTMSNYKFDRVSTRYGVSQRSFVVLPEEQNLNVSIIMEEDRYSNVAVLIKLLQKRIVDERGFYRAPVNQYVSNMVLDIYDDQKFPVSQYDFDNVLFLGADDISRSYGSGDSVRYSLNFAVDRIGFKRIVDPARDMPIVSIGQRIANRAIAATRRGISRTQPALGMIDTNPRVNGPIPPQGT